MAPSQAAAMKLPLELLSRIFKCVELNDRQALELVCRNWQDTLILNSSWWEHLELEYLEESKEKNAHQYQKYLFYRRCSRDAIKSIKITCWSKEEERSSSLVKFLSSNHSSLESLDFNVVKGNFASEQVESLLDLFLRRHPNLTRLRLFNYKGQLFPTIDDYLRELPRLQELDLSTEPYANLDLEPKLSEFPKGIYQGMHPIKSLRVDRCFRRLLNTFTLDNLEFLELNSHKAYEILDFATSSSSLISFPRLLTLCGQFCGRSGHTIKLDTPMLGSLTLLREISGFSFTKNSLTKLKCLHLDAFSSAVGLVDIMALSSNLQEFSACAINWNEEIHRLVLEQFSKMPYLQTVKLNRMRIYDEFIDGLDNVAPKLHTLDISCTCITSLSLNRLVRNRISSSSKSRILSITASECMEDIEYLKENVECFEIIAQ